MSISHETPTNILNHQFSGNIFIFHSFDVGDEINLHSIKDEQMITRRPHMPRRYFKNYHIPLEVELPHPHSTSHCDSAKIHGFGAITLRYKIPFTATLEKLKAKIDDIDDEYRQHSVQDALSIFRVIKKAIRQPRFFHLNTSYMMIQVDIEDAIPGATLKEQAGDTIASILRFELTNLSEYKKNEILEDAFGYLHGDLIVIDTEAAFVYDADYNEILEIFEFVNLQQLELQYFDQLLDQKLNVFYEKDVNQMSLRSYLPLVGMVHDNAVAELGKLKVDISVITERLANSIKVVGEPYYYELYRQLNEKLDLRNWRDSLNSKLSIVHDISTVYQHRATAVREDLFNLLIVILILVECTIAVISYFQS